MKIVILVVQNAHWIMFHDLIGYFVNVDTSKNTVSLIGQTSGNQGGYILHSINTADFTEQATPELSEQDLAVAACNKFREELFERVEAVMLKGLEDTDSVFLKIHV